MRSQKDDFLQFLENINPLAAQSAREMEILIYEDPSSAMIKARKFAEEILNEVFKQEKIEVPFRSTFNDKIIYLSNEGYIEKEIQQSLDIIRYSGNKAAHDVTFNDITDAFKLHKEMYKVGVWFYEVYSLEQLNVPLYVIPKPREKENIEDVVKKQIEKLLGMGIIPNATPSDSKSEDQNKVSNTNEENIFNKELKTGESYLLRELRRLRDSSQEAVENASQFSSFKDYMHVERKIQKDFEMILEKNQNRNTSNLILLCGSVGDGKSHLLAYLNKKRPDLLKEYTIFNDATESFSPSKNAMETLEDVLSGFSDTRVESSKDKVILAINMGVLHNFIHTKHKEHGYETLKHFIKQSELFSQKITTHFSDNTYDLLSFGDYHTYELTKEGTESSFYSSLLNKIVDSSPHNPFYLALREDEKSEKETIVHQNYKMMQNKIVQHQVVQLVVQVIVKKKLVISARSFLNFIADILIPDDVQNINLLTEFTVLESSLPNLLFNRKDRSPLLQAISHLDPIHCRSVFIDQLIIKLNTLSKWEEIIENNIQDEISKLWLKPFMVKENLTEQSFNTFFEAFIRITLLTTKDFSSKIADSSYKEYLEHLYYFNSGDKKRIKAFYDEIKQAIFKWKGSSKREYILLNKQTDKIRLSQKLNVKPSIDHLISIPLNTEGVLETFKSSIIIAYHAGDTGDKVFLEIDYSLYQLLKKVQNGYRPNKTDEENAINFVEFVEKLMKYGEKKNELLVHFPLDQRFYKLKRDDFGAFVFERE